MYVWLTRHSFDYVYKESISDLRMYAVHTDFVYFDFSRTVFQSTIRIFKYVKKYVRNDKYLKQAASNNSDVHSYPAICKKVGKVFRGVSALHGRI